MNDRQLRRWLMREIHGVEIQRKPPKKSSSLIGSKPARNGKYRAWVRSLPCASCGREPAGEAAHTETGGLRQKGSDYSCIPLCSDCHTMGPHAYHRAGKAAFEAHHGVDVAATVARLKKIWFNPAAREM